MKSHRITRCIILILVCCFGCRSKLIQPGVHQIITLQGAYTGTIWSPTSNEILSTWYVFPSHKTKIYIFDVQTGKQRLVIEEDGELYAEAWSPDGRKIALDTYATSNYTEGIWIIEFDSQTSQYIGLGDTVSWSPNGEKLAIFSCELSSDKNLHTAYIKLYDTNAGEFITVYQEEQCTRNAILTWSPDGTKLSFSYSKDSSNAEIADRVYLLDITNGQVELWDNTPSWNPSWSPEENILVYIRGTGGFFSSQLVVVDIETRCEMAIDNLELSFIGGVSWSPDGTMWAIGEMGKLYFIDIKTLVGMDILEEGVPCP